MSELMPHFIAVEGVCYTCAHYTEAHCKRWAFTFVKELSEDNDNDMLCISPYDTRCFQYEEKAFLWEEPKV